MTTTATSISSAPTTDRTALYRNVDGKQFVDVAPELGLAIDNCYDTGAWGDWDNDGRIDLYVNGTVTRGRSFEDYLFHNDPARFSDVTTDLFRKYDADHGVQWFDFDGDGDLDLALTNAAAGGMHYLLRNDLPGDRARRSLQVAVVDAGGHYTRAGAEIRIYDSGTGKSPRHRHHGHRFRVRFPEFHAGALRARSGKPGGCGGHRLTLKGRKSARLAKVDPSKFLGRYLTVKTDANGMIVK